MIQHLNINRRTIFLRKIKIYGKVQGVFFRTTAKEQAEKLGLKGFVRNEKGGTVYIETEGTQENLDKFLRWCHGGPEAAHVIKIEVEEGPLKNFSNFDRDFTDY